MPNWKLRSALYDSYNTDSHANSYLQTKSGKKPVKFQLARVNSHWEQLKAPLHYPHELEVMYVGKRDEALLENLVTLLP